jgi:hypothetical protein
MRTRYLFKGCNFKKEIFMNLVKIPLIVLIASVLTACGVRPHTFVSTYTEEKLPVTTSFTGSNTISGSAFLRTTGGSVITCAGSNVVLKRNLDFERSAYAKEANGLPTYYYGKKVREATDIDPRHTNFEMKLNGLKHLRKFTTTCDGNGNFSFSGLGTGKYKIMTTVFWRSGDSGQGGLVLGEVEIPSGSSKSTTKVVVNDYVKSCSDYCDADENRYRYLY